MSSNAPNSSTSWIGRRLGNPERYRLDRRLGGGAVGDVFLAMDIHLGRRVAIKILKGSYVKSKELLARFEREVALSVALESEHIVQVIDYGVAPGGYPFYVMEYLQGQTLSQFMGRSGRLPMAQAVTIARQICRGLEVAHQGITLWKKEATVSEQVKVIHRDLKPANIFVVNTALGELAKILDFGIAKKLHVSEQAEQTNLTQAFLGTFRYAAPEQLRSAWKLDERADIYSLGMILYEMLTGTDPFGVLKKAQGEAAWVSAHASVAPIPLRQQAGCSQFPEALEAVVMRCLRKPAAERFASATDLGRSLDAIMQTVHVLSDSSLPDSLLPPVAEEQLDPTVQRPLTASEAPTAHHPLVPSVAAQTSTQPTASSKQISPDATTAQTPVPAPDFNCVLMPYPSASPSAEGTIAQIPSTPARERGAAPEGTMPEGTIVQRSSTPKPQVPPPAASPASPEGTIAQIPSRSPLNPPFNPVEATRYQPRQSPSPEGTLVQRVAAPRHFGAEATPLQVPVQPRSNVEGTVAQVAQPLRSGNQSGAQAGRQIAQPLHSGDRAGMQAGGQVKDWLKSSSENYANRIRAQVASEARHGAYRFVSRLLPMGVGFAFGLAAMSGAYIFLRSKAPGLPSLSRPVPTINK